MRPEPQDTESGPCWPRKPEFGGALQARSLPLGATRP